MNEIGLLVILLIVTVIGYKLISRVPSLLHTPLMSGMNALSGLTMIGAILLLNYALSINQKILVFIAILLASVNVSGGFFVTWRMLRMFKIKKEDK